MSLARGAICLKHHRGLLARSPCGLLVFPNEPVNVFEEDLEGFEVAQIENCVEKLTGIRMDRLPVSM